ncbi:TraB/GumN family protein [Puia sp.]|uniref:TraB/GumN family protein n=1 Tax=Puia sp. TaxID=2045100 RepID=UPI002F3E3DF8
MRSTPFRFCAPATVLLLLLTIGLPAQRRVDKKYPALLWEITGNGLKKPSYLFGTMHVSSKLVFHLSDSFYLDIRNSDVVALELDPQLWQDQLFRFENLQSNLRFYTQGAPGDLINEHSFQLENYESRLKSALSEEPTVINGLLYRTFRTQADFEEDTYLDLYIYQTGKKLGKQATGVENYFQTERLVMEATQDMLKDRKKKAPDTDGESAYEIERKTQEAYRKGDLDLLDSLEKLMEPSEAYMEKFLYRRNEIQAASIDSIVRHHSLFVGVGAAHLPGKRGVIELLRKKGYILRPVIMPDQDANRRDDIDRIKVPVSFSTFTSEDGDFSVQLPGKLYRRNDSRSPDSWQYADMGNGAYYMIGRVKTHSSFLGQKEEAVQKKVDSLLYENIPGKILKKTAITRSGYKGYDVTARTRRGDIQRYNILITPAEVWVFKMSGTNTYVDGPEAEQFFGSIRIRNNAPAHWAPFSPARGGFSVAFPHPPFQNKNTFGSDGITRWEYEATDSVTGDAYLLWKKTVQNYRFMEEDTADLALMEESFRSSDYIDKLLSRRPVQVAGHAGLDATYQEKDGSFLRARFILHGADYYLLAAHSRSKTRPMNSFFGMFAFTPYQYPVFRNYVDTFIHIGVTTPMVPDVDTGMRGIIERASSEEFLNSIPDYNNYWPRAKTALFQDDSTGEAIYVSVESFPKYYYPKDSLSFWQEETNEKRLRRDLIVCSKQPYINGDEAGYRYVLTDTNTTRRIDMRIFLKGSHLFRIVSLNDSLAAQSDFLARFYSSFHPVASSSGAPVFQGKLDLFFRDFESPDSLVAKRAKEAIPNVYFGAAGVPRLLEVIANLAYNGKDYFDTKTKFINELGYINDSAATPGVVAGLKQIYERAGDTSLLQNAVLKALAHHRTMAAYQLLKQLMIQDPPVFDNASEYTGLFRDIGDSLALARTLFPSLLQLSTVDDYKANIQSLLADLVDSNYLRAADYEPWFSQIYFDAKIQWKKQESKDERRLQKKEEDNDDNTETDGEEAAGNDLDDYAILLMPFYDKNPTIPHFFEKLLQSRDPQLRLSTSLLLLRHGRPVADSIFLALAANDASRSLLYQGLVAIGSVERFPLRYRTQEDIARSLLVASRGANEFAAIQLVDKQPAKFKDTKGWVYFFKYKINKDDDWQLGLSGIQPVNRKDLSTDASFVMLTAKKLKASTPAVEQFAGQWRKLLLSRRKSAASFFQDGEYHNLQPDED